MCSISWSGWPAPMRGRPISRRWKPISSGRSLRRAKAGCSIGSNARASSTSCWPAATGNKVIAMIVDSVTEIHMRFVYAKVASSGVAMPRLAEKRRQFLSALRARDVATATRLMRAPSGIGAADAGAGSRRDVASCRAGRDAAGHAPLNARRAANRPTQTTIQGGNVSRYAKYECLKVEVADKVATVTLNRPQARNAINQKLIRELRTIWDDLATIMPSMSSC